MYDIIFIGCDSMDEKVYYSTFDNKKSDII